MLENTHGANHARTRSSCSARLAMSTPSRSCGGGFAKLCARKKVKSAVVVTSSHSYCSQVIGTHQPGRRRVGLVRSSLEGALAGDGRSGTCSERARRGGQHASVHRQPGGASPAILVARRHLRCTAVGMQLATEPSRGEAVTEPLPHLGVQLARTARWSRARPGRGASR